VKFKDGTEAGRPGGDGRRHCPKHGAGRIHASANKGIVVNDTMQTVTDARITRWVNAQPTVALLRPGGPAVRRAKVAANHLAQFGRSLLGSLTSTN
jgi:nitrite reductase (NADH) large subunit